MAYDLPSSLDQLTKEGRLTATDNWGPQANTGTPYTAFASTWIGPSAVPTEAELQGAQDRIPLPREPRPLWDIYTDLGLLAGTTLTAIWNDLLAGTPPKWTTLVPPQDGSASGLHWSAMQSGAPAAAINDARKRMIALVVQQFPNYLVNNPSFPGVSVPGDRPVS